jgi:hypothetical protein
LSGFWSILKDNFSFRSDVDRFEFREFYDANILVKKINGNMLEVELKMPAIHGNEQIISKELERKYKQFQVQVANGTATIKGPLDILKGKM